MLRGTQAIMDQYRAGVEITQVQLQKVDPPAQVVDAFRDVQRANADRERAAQRGREPTATTSSPAPAARPSAWCRRPRASATARSPAPSGEAQRFTSVLAAYQAAQDVTMRRMYLETMEEILRRNPKSLVDDRLQGLVPLPALGDGAAAAPAGAAPPAGRAAARVPQRPRAVPGRPPGVPR